NEQTGIKPASKVWEYFNRVENEASLQAECIICKQRLKTPSYSTSPLVKHLLKHGIEYEKGGMLCARTSAMSKEQKRKLDDPAIKAIVQGGRSFGDLRKLGISKFIQQCAPTSDSHCTSYNVDKKRQRRNETKKVTQLILVPTDTDSDESNKEQEQLALVNVLN
ncbi:unnamed protein product, partial [Didymodactylos carnosus]